MLNALLVLAALIGALAAALWVAGGREPVYRVSRDGPAFVAAIKYAGAPTDPVLAAGVTETWRGDARHGLIGPADPYWDRFLVLTGGTAGEMPLTLGTETADALVAEVRLMQPPRMALGAFRLLQVTGLRGIPDGETWHGEAQPGLRPEMLPAPDNVDWLLAQPDDFGPAMFNFLKYRETAAYDPPRDGDPGTGADAYGRYGAVAMQTVMRTGGELHFAGRVRAILRPATGWEMGSDWDDLAVMRYPRPEAILSMERVDAYRASLKHRDAGLSDTVVIATEATIR